MPILIQWYQNMSRYSTELPVILTCFTLVVVLKNCDLELSYILAQLFNKCLKEFSFPDCCKVSSVVPVFKNVGESSTAKNYCPVSLLSLVSKVFEKLENTRTVDHVKKCGLFIISSMVLGLPNQLQIF